MLLKGKQPSILINMLLVPPLPHSLTTPIYPHRRTKPHFTSPTQSCCLRAQAEKMNLPVTDSTRALLVHSKPVFLQRTRHHRFELTLINWASVLYPLHSKCLIAQHIQIRPNSYVLAFNNQFLTVRSVCLRVQSYLISYSVCFRESHLNVVISIGNSCIFYNIAWMHNISSGRRDFNLNLIPIANDF